jgi:GT2 family glycosyltransferase
MRDRPQEEMTQAVDISVVIPTLNRGEILCQTLGYLLAEEQPPFEIIVIDQTEMHSATVEDRLAVLAPRITYARVRYKSLTRAKNHGVRLARAPIVLFLDDDIVPSRGLIKTHWRHFANSVVVAVTGPVLNAGDCLKTLQQIDDRSLDALLKQRSMRFDVDFPFVAQWAAGGNVSFRRDVIIRLGGFDETFQGESVGEDAEFSFRARKLGSIQYVPEASLVHLAVGAGGCRDFATDSERVRRGAFNDSYFAARTGAPIWIRARSSWRSFRRHVLNRRVLSSRKLLPLCVSFGCGLWCSTNAKPRLGLEWREHDSSPDPLGAETRTAT